MLKNINRQIMEMKEEPNEIFLIENVEIKQETVYPEFVYEAKIDTNETPNIKTEYEHLPETLNWITSTAEYANKIEVAHYNLGQTLPKVESKVESRIEVNSNFIKIKNELDVLKSELLTEECDLTLVKSETDLLDYYNQPCTSKDSQSSLATSQKGAVTKIVKKKRWYPCPVCGKNFSTCSSRENHFNAHFRKRCVLCALCGQIFVRKAEFLHHYVKHVASINIFRNADTTIDCISSECTSLLDKHVRFHRLRRNNFHTRKKVDATNFFQCGICFKSFSEKAHLNIHLENHTGEKLFKCGICLKKYMYKSQLFKHLRFHTGQKTFKCGFCSKTFIYKCSFTSLARKGPSKCEICLKQFSPRSRFVKHTRSHVSQKRSKCELCFEKLRSDLNKHLHTGGMLLKCDICLKTFHQKSELSKHLDVHAGERPFKCTICSKRFTHKSYLNRHSRTHSGDRAFSCDICLKTFRNKTHLASHMNIHTGEKPHKCDVCLRNFTHKSNLSKHYKIHTGEKHYECDVCLKQFTFKTDFTRHLSVHTGEKPFKCDICFKQFTRKAYLTIHLKIHTGEKPHKCDVCSKCFTNKSNLNKHLKIHTGEKSFQCDICFKYLIDKWSLNRHKMVHTNSSNPTGSPYYKLKYIKPKK